MKFLTATVKRAASSRSLAEQVIELAAKAGIVEVEGAAKALWDLFRRMRRNESAKALWSFRVGQKVKLVGERDSYRLPKGSIGKVVRLGQTNVTVDFGEYKTWRIPADWLSAAFR